MAEGQYATDLTIENTETPPQNPSNNNNNPFFFLSLIPKFLMKPFVDNKNENGESVKRVDAEEGSGNNSKVPDVVRFTKSQPDIPPLKLENEDAQEDTNPLILWQIYALGGFIILKWAWGKWQERKGNNASAGEDSDQDQPPAEASASAPAPAAAED